MAAPGKASFGDQRVSLARAERTPPRAALGKDVSKESFGQWHVNLELSVYLRQHRGKHLLGSSARA